MSESCHNNVNVKGIVCEKGVQPKKSDIVQNDEKRKVFVIKSVKRKKVTI